MSNFRILSNKFPKIFLSLFFPISLPRLCYFYVIFRRERKYLEELINVVWSSTLSNTRTIQIAKCPQMSHYFTYLTAPRQSRSQGFKNSLSIRRFSGEGEGWREERKRERAKGEKLSPLHPLPSPLLKSPCPSGEDPGNEVALSAAMSTTAGSRKA